MKKILFFAMMLAAGVMAFTGCKKDKDGADDPEKTLDPAALLNTSWRTDSVKANGVQQPAPHFYLQILGAKVGYAVINNDTVSYSFEGKTLICRGDKYEVTSYTGTTAVLNGDGADLYLSKMPEWGTQYMEPKSADFVGTWKLAYYTMDAHTTGGVWSNLGTNPGVETWELKADGKATYHNTFTKETINGTWSYEYGMIMVNNPAQPILQGDDDRITVQPLTTNWMGFIRGDGTTTYQWWFIRVK